MLNNNKKISKINLRIMTTKKPSKTAFSGPPCNHFDTSDLYWQRCILRNKLWPIQSQPKESIRLEKGRVLRIQRGQINSRESAILAMELVKSGTFPSGLGPFFTKSIGSIGDPLELIWPPWILSTRSFSKCILSFGGDCMNAKSSIVTLVNQST